MCLDLTNDSKLQIATEDIVCYKRVNKIFIPDTKILKQLHGVDFEGIISGYKCSGKISISDDGMIYFCTNDPRLQGASCSNKFEFNYSWYLDDDVTSIYIDNIKTPTAVYKTPYRRVSVEIGQSYFSKLIRTSLNEVSVGLHSFVTRQDAIEDGEGIVVRCIIPKGSEFYFGQFCGVDAMASNCIKYVEIIS